MTHGFISSLPSESSEWSLLNMDFLTIVVIDFRFIAQERDCRMSSDELWSGSRCFLFLFLDVGCVDLVESSSISELLVVTFFCLSPESASTRPVVGAAPNERLAEEGAEYPTSGSSISSNISPELSLGIKLITDERLHELAIDALLDSNRLYSFKSIGSFNGALRWNVDSLLPAPVSIIGQRHDKLLFCMQRLFIRYCNYYF